MDVDKTVRKPTTKSSPDQQTVCSCLDVRIWAGPKLYCPRNYFCIHECQEFNLRNSKRFGCEFHSCSVLWQRLRLLSASTLCACQIPPHTDRSGPDQRCTPLNGSVSDVQIMFLSLSLCLSLSSNVVSPSSSTLYRKHVYRSVFLVHSFIHQQSSHVQ